MLYYILGCQDVERSYVDVEIKTLGVVEVRPTQNPWEKENIAKWKWAHVARRAEEETHKKIALGELCIKKKKLNRYSLSSTF